MTDQQARISERLHALARKHGRLTPDMVVEDARDKRSPLHGEFEWDTKKAASLHWLTRAREIIRSVRVVIEVRDVRVASVAYVRDPHAPSAEQGYLAVSAIRSDRELAQATILQELDRLDAVLTRVRRLADALDVTNYVVTVANEVAALRRQVEDQQAST